VRAVFVDRDGVVNRNRTSNVRSRREFRFLPGALEALALLRAHGLSVVVATNQSAVGRGHMTRARLDGIHRHMLDRVVACGGRVDGVYVFTHAPWEGCTAAQCELTHRSAQRPWLARDLADAVRLILRTLDAPLTVGGGSRVAVQG
jgi:histidinol-phosphate phosphatase family protein